MANTQYIGSRYVPLFADPVEWSSTKSYEALTIVLHEGNSFTSKQYVPVGIDITNEEYWAETGNYNAQVEQYRRETLSVQNDINTLLPKEAFSENNTVKDYIDSAYERIQLIQNEIKLISPYLQGTSVFIKHGPNALMLDCGDTTDNLRMDNFLQSQNVERLSCVVITHFDHDHMGAFATVAKYCDSDTDIFIQMEPLTGSNNYVTYQTGLNDISQYINQYNLKTPSVPTEGMIVTYDDINIEFHNTTLENRTLYDSVNSESTPYNNRQPSLNNYSLISIVDINGYVITYSGDVEAAAQRVNTQYMKKSALSFVPHHISGISGYLPWYMKQAPQQWLGTTAASVFGQNIYINNRYIIKMIRYNYMSDVIMTHNYPLVVEIINGAYNILSGESLIASMAEEDKDTVYTVFYQIIPPSYETDNPFILYDITLNQLVAACHLGLIGRYSMAPAITGRADMQVFKDIKKLMYNTTALDSLQITITTGRYLDIEFQSDTTAYNHLIVYNNVNPDARTGYRLVENQTTWKHLLETPQSTVDLAQTLTAFQLASLFRSRSSYVVLDNGVFIPMFRTENNNSENPGMGVASLGGMAITGGDMLNLTRAWASYASNTLTATTLNLSTKAVTNANIAAIGVM